MPFPSRFSPRCRTRLFEGGYEVKIGMVAALIVCLRFQGLTMLVAGWAVVIALRHFVIA